MAKRERQEAEDRAFAEEQRARNLESDNKSLRDQLKDISNAKEEYYKRACELDTLKVEMDRLRHFEADNGRLRDQLRDMEHR